MSKIFTNEGQQARSVVIVDAAGGPERAAARFKVELEDAEPFEWTATAASILDKIAMVAMLNATTGNS
jgi:hypothetical protein